MLDLSHIPNSQQDIKVYNANGNSWQTWQKPRKCQWVWIMAIGGGGGGSFGSSTISAANTGGGSGAVTRAIFNALDIQDTLYIQVGLGGIGGVQNVTSPTSGSRSFVSFFPTTTAANVIVSSGNTGAGAGVTGDSGLTAAGETSATSTSAVFIILSNYLSTIGISTIGITGSAAPTNITPLTSQIVTPGAMGAGLPALNTISPDNGGSILSSTISPLIAGGLATAVVGATAQNGADGITSFKPFFSTGGAGGGSANNTSDSGFGGNGGKGGIGSGGGGGGSGKSGAGIGGNGGDGIVIIVSF